MEPTCPSDQSKKLHHVNRLTLHAVKWFSKDRLKNISRRHCAELKKKVIFLIIDQNRCQLRPQRCLCVTHVPQVHRWASTGQCQSLPVSWQFRIDTWLLHDLSLSLCASVCGYDRKCHAAVLSALNLTNTQSKSMLLQQWSHQLHWICSLYIYLFMFVCLFIQIIVTSVDGWGQRKRTHSAASTQ